MYIADTGNSRIIKSDSNGVFESQIGMPGSGNGQFSAPRGLAVDGSTNVLVADSSNDRTQLLNPSGGFLAQWGNAGNGSFSVPAGVSPGGAGEIYVADTGNSRIQRLGGPTGPTGPSGPTGPTGPVDPGTGDDGSDGSGGDPKPRITKVKLTPKRGWVYRGGYLNMTVAVTNKGKAAAYDVWVHLYSSRKRVRVTSLVKVEKIKPGWTVTEKIKVKPKRKVRGKVKIKAKAWGEVGRSTLKLIRPWW